MGRLVILVSLLLGLVSAPAVAHPHVWVSVRAEILVGPDGMLTGIRHHWTFDKSYSALLVQGIARDPEGRPSGDKLQAIARENVEALADSGWFTFIKHGGRKLGFEPPRDYGMSYAGDEATLNYLLPLKAPEKIGRSLRLDIYDPTFFVDFQVAPGEDAVRLVGAPAGCKLDIRRPKTEPPPQTQQQMSESFFQALTDAADYGAKFSGGMLVTCP